MADHELTPSPEKALSGTLTDYAPPIAPTALEALTRGELDVQIATARRWPRSLALFKQRVLTMVRLDAETARTMYYALPRRQRQDDGTVKRVTIKGPSVRLAEVAAGAWGNLRAGSRIIGEDRENVMAQGFCHDLETNNAIVLEISRPIIDRDGRRFSPELITMTKNAACSIARRKAVFSIIPQALIDPFVDIAMKVVAGEAKTLIESRQRALATFAEIGVTPAAICDKLERQGIEDITLEDLSVLAGILTAIREKESSVEDEFPAAAAPAAGRRTAQLSVEAERRRRAAQGTGTGPETPVTSPPPTPDPPPEPPDTVA